MTIKYTEVISAYGVNSGVEFREKVNQHLAEGWVLRGPLIYTASNHRIQPMIKNSFEEEMQEYVLDYEDTRKTLWIWEDRIEEILNRARLTGDIVVFKQATTLLDELRDQYPAPQSKEVQ
jgi:hypothetical protein